MALSWGVFHSLASRRERVLDEGPVTARSPGDLGELAPDGARQRMPLGFLCPLLLPGRAGGPQVLAGQSREGLRVSKGGCAEQG